MGSHGWADIMSIDIDTLTEAELVDLNRRVVERLKFLAQMKVHGAMLEFSIGQRVGATQVAGRQSLASLSNTTRKRLWSLPMTGSGGMLPRVSCERASLNTLRRARTI
jgi:hypothetical protein